VFAPLLESLSWCQPLLVSLSWCQPLLESLPWCQLLLESLSWFKPGFGTLLELLSLAQTVSDLQVEGGSIHGVKIQVSVMVQTGGKVTCRNSMTARSLFGVSVLCSRPSSSRYRGVNPSSCRYRGVNPSSSHYRGASSSSSRYRGSNRGSAPSSSCYRGANPVV